MIHDPRFKARRLCVVLAAASAGWSLLALGTGGISFPFFSSRNPRNPALAAALMIVSAWALADSGNRVQLLLLDLRWHNGQPWIQMLRSCPRSAACDRPIG